MNRLLVTTTAAEFITFLRFFLTFFEARGVSRMSLNDYSELLRMLDGSGIGLGVTTLLED